MTGILLIIVVMTAPAVGAGERAVRRPVRNCVCQSVGPGAGAAQLQVNPDDVALQKRIWADMKNGRLSDNDIRLALDHAFHLITQDSVETWWVFERRSAPEFVYIQPRRFVFIKDGRVVADQPVDIRGNGIEVHQESSGRGPFAGPLPTDEEGHFRIDEFRFYYEVTYAPEMKWLEGFESYLTLRLTPDPKPAAARDCSQSAPSAGTCGRPRCRILQPLRRLLLRR